MLWLISHEAIKFFLLSKMLSGNLQNLHRLFHKSTVQIFTARSSTVFFSGAQQETAKSSANAGGILRDTWSKKRKKKSSMVSGEDPDTKKVGLSNVRHQRCEIQQKKNLLSRPLAEKEGDELSVIQQRQTLIYKTQKKSVSL